MTRRSWILLAGGAALAGLAAATVPPIMAERANEAAASRPSSRTLTVTVDVAERKLYAEPANGPVQAFDVTVGTPKHPTPRGSYRISRITWNPRWVPPNSDWAKGLSPKGPGDPANPMGRVKMFFRQPAYYVHGTNDERSIGRAASHGCVRMRNQDVIELARLVMEHGGEPREPSWFERVVRLVTRTTDVELSTPVPIRIR